MLALDKIDTTHYTLSMKRGKRYIGEIDGVRHWKAVTCGHPVANFQTKRCWDCWGRIRGEVRKGEKRKITIYGDQHHSWKGGRVIHKHSGYVLLKRREHPNSQKNGYVYEHRVVMEEYLGRFLEPVEEVHHINHNKSDNRIENLMLFSNHADHIAYEHKNGERVKC